MLRTSLLLASLVVIVILTWPKVLGAEPSLYFDEPRLASIDRYIKQSMAESRVPGAAIALIESGRVVHLKGYGVADKSGRLVSAQTPFQLASITKGFTALLMVQLEQEGKLSLTDPITKFIPWFTTSIEGQANNISLRNLLQHNSGFSTAVGNLTQNTRYRGDDATELSVKKLLNTKLVAEPGAEYQYSNANYHIASHIIELLEQKPFEQVMAERVFRPLKMSQSYVQLPPYDTGIEPEAVGFPHWFGHPVERSFTLGRMKMGDGGVVASAEDLANYIMAMQNAGSPVVSPEMKANLLDHQQNSGVAYALGWEIFTVDDRVIYGHGGANGGFSTWFGFTEPSDDRNGLGIVILTNSSSTLYDRFVSNARRIILGKDPVPVRNQVNLILLFVQYLTILLLAVLIYRELFRSVDKTVSPKRFTAPAVLIVISYINAYLVPSFNRINLLSIYPFFPDLAVGLIGVASLSLILALLKLGRALRGWRAESTA